MINILIWWTMTEQFFWILWFSLVSVIPKLPGSMFGIFSCFQARSSATVLLDGVCWCCNSEKTWHRSSNATETAFLKMSWTQFSTPNKNTRATVCGNFSPPFTLHVSPLCDVFWKSMIFRLILRSLHLTKALVSNVDSAPRHHTSSLSHLLTDESNAEWY